MINPYFVKVHNKDFVENIYYSKSSIAFLNSALPTNYMRVGVVGTSFDGRRTFRIQIARGVSGYPNGIAEFCGSLEKLQSLTDPSDRYYVIKPQGEKYALMQEARKSQTLIGYIEDAAAA